MGHVIKKKILYCNNIFVRISFFNAFYKRQKCPLIFGLKGFAAKEGKTVYIVGLKHFDYLVFGFLGKRLTKVKIPGFGLKTALTPVCAARNEKGDTHPFAIGNITIFDLSVMHYR